MSSPSDVDAYIETLRSGECISERGIKRLCASVSEILMEENNVQPVISPVTVRDTRVDFSSVLVIRSILRCLLGCVVFGC